MVQKSDTKQYWFNQEDLLRPIDWKYLESLPKSVQDAFELYMRGNISFGKASEIAHLSYREMDLIRAKARIPMHV
ncbi:MAG: hypothetical protein EU532_07660 [Promethearchaeota archaeon]|nr:MAG: hypothetical protein EU532_07660 [Candidatus Lokiarchaeota archaeon]